MDDNSLDEEIEKAIESDVYMVAVWHVKDGRVNMFRLSQNFPFVEVPVAINLLKDDFDIK